MSVVEMLSSMQQIQTRLASLSGTTAASSTDSAASSATFDQLVASQSSTSATASTPSAGGLTGASVVADAKKYLGIPYVLDGESSSGMDCSGLVQKTYKDLGVSLPRGVREQKTMGTAVPSLAQAQPGDLIVFKGGGHIAIYEGNNTVIHAPYPGRTVSEQKLWVGDSGIETIRRIAPTAGTTAAPVASTTTPSATSSTALTASSASLAATQATLQAEITMLQSLSASANSIGSGLTGTLGSTSALGSTSSASAASPTDVLGGSILDPSSSATSATGSTSLGSMTPAEEIEQFMSTVDAAMQQGLS